MKHSTIKLSPANITLIYRAGSLWQICERARLYLGQASIPLI